MNNLKATKEDYQKRKEAYTKVKEYIAKNYIKAEDLHNKIYDLECQIEKYRQQIADLRNEGDQYFNNNFKKYYPDSCIKIKETDTREEAFKKDDYWRK